MKRYLISFYCVLVSNLAIVLCFPAPESRPAIPTCCNDGEWYVLGLGECRPASLDNRWPPLPVNNSQVPAVKVNASLISCQPGKVVQTSFNFTYFDNAALHVRNGRHVQRSNEYCLNPVQLGDESSAWAAVYCVDDPCKNSATCVKKCCPNGMSMNGTHSRCETSDAKFNATFHSETGSTVQIDNYVTRDVAVPVCDIGMFLLTSDEFQLLPDGRLYELDSKAITADYCVDHFTFEDSTYLNALVCFEDKSGSWEHDDVTISL